jgi:glycosyltransferase involved in cell wall biosynthesis
MPDALRVIVLSALPTDSGSSLRARYLAESLERAGARVRLLHNTRSLPLRLDYPLSLVHYLRALAIPCDVIIGLKPLPNVTLVLMAKRLLGAYAVLDIDDNDFGFRTGPIAWINRLVQLPFPRRCDLVTYHADRLREFIVRTYGVAESRLHQVPQAVDITTFAPRDATGARREILAALGLANAKLIAYPAHLNVASELPAVLDILAAARARQGDVHLLVIGGGPLERRYRRLVEGRGLRHAVTFTGHLSPKRVADHIAASDLGVVFYRDVEVNLYRQSMKLREMLALGLPVVCNSVGDLGAFRDYTYQAASDAASMANVIIRVLAAGGDGRERRGAEFVRRTMSWDETGEGILELLLAKLGRSPRDHSHPIGGSPA